MKNDYQWTLKISIIIIWWYLIFDLALNICVSSRRSLGSYSYSRSSEPLSRHRWTLEAFQFKIGNPCINLLTHLILFFNDGGKIRKYLDLLLYARSACRKLFRCIPTSGKSWWELILIWLSAFYKGKSHPAVGQSPLSSTTISFESQLAVFQAHLVNFLVHRVYTEAVSR